MKINLGKIFLTILVFLNIQLFAQEYKWSATADKTSAFVNEAIYLKYVCEFSDRGELYSIDFNPAGVYENYDLILLKEAGRVLNRKRINSYEFVAFVKKSGKIEFDLEAKMKKTTQESIKNTVLGRDNVENEDFTVKLVKQKKLSVDIKESSVDLVGDFKLEVKKDKPNKKAFEPFHMEVVVNGVGNFQVLKPLEFNIKNVKVFAQKPIEKTVLTKDGYSGVWSQKFAFVSEDDFELPQKTIKYIDLKDNLQKELNIVSTKVLMTKAYKKEELLDKEEKAFEFSYEFIYYILTFIAGFLLAKVQFKREKVDVIECELSKDKIKNAKSLDELLILLILQDSNKYSKLISQIETDSSVSLSNIKKQLLGLCTINIK